MRTRSNYTVIAPLALRALNHLEHDVDLAEATRLAVENTKYISADSIEIPGPSEHRSPVHSIDTTIIHVVDRTSTQEVIHAMLGEHVYNSPQVAVLNFASASNPGGGFLRDAKAQEEDLCRNSGLYPCLEGHPEFYTAPSTKPLYTNDILYSENVPFFAHGSFTCVDVITCAAPNLSGDLIKSPRSLKIFSSNELETLWVSRWTRVLDVARAHSIEHLVLGAWGCGVFANDAEQVARTFVTAFLKSYGLSFKNVVFAIPKMSVVSTKNHEVFDRIIRGMYNNG